MRCVFAALVSLLLFGTAVMVAHAEPRTPGQPGSARPNRPSVEATVVTTEAGVVIQIAMRVESPGAPGSPGSTEIVNAPPAPVCTVNAVNISYPSVEGGAGWINDGLREHPGTIPFAVVCDTHLTIAWVPTDAPGPPDIVIEVLPADPVDPEAMAAALLGIVPVPTVQVGASPDTGLVALPSWYWVDGYDGRTLHGSESLGDTTVEVRIHPDRYEWSFGDGATTTTRSLGQPYPAESDIRHTYERSAPAFEVRLVIVFRAESRVITEEPDGLGGTVTVVGAWEDAGEIERTFARSYAVRQVQAVLTAQ